MDGEGDAYWGYLQRSIALVRFSNGGHCAGRENESPKSWLGSILKGCQDLGPECDAGTLGSSIRGSNLVGVAKRQPVCRYTWYLGFQAGIAAHDMD